MSTEHVIESRELRREFGSFVAVRDVSFDVEKGEIFGYLGANGAGKSTTIRMLCGLLEPTRGSARVAGFDVAENPNGVKSSIGYMSQKFSLYRDLRVRENLEFFGGVYGLYGRELRVAIDRSIERTGLGPHIGALTGDLPGGIRQRVALSCAILHRPRIVFLDEPTAGVDPTSRREFWHLIRELAESGTTIFVTTHYMDEAEYCARIGLMVDGLLVALDTPSELKRRYVPGISYSVAGRGLEPGRRRLEAANGVYAAEPFGARVQVRIAEGSLGESDIAQAFLPEGNVERIDVVQNSLEDVFLAVVGESKAAVSNAAESKAAESKAAESKATPTHPPQDIS